MRNAFAQEITMIAAENPDIILLSGDIGNRLFDNFRKIAPDRFFNCGVAEANMTGVAAGMALCGFRPITYSITPFVTTRCMEQIRVDLCYHNLPVVVVGTGAGLSYAQLGPTHHSCEDIGMLRMLPNMTILCPCDPLEVRAALRTALEHEGPVYIRLGKKGEPDIHSDLKNFVIGKSITVKGGDEVCFLNTGNTMSLALEVANKIEDQGLSVRVESMHTVKPLDTEMLNDIFNQYRLVVTFEEHSVLGGLGGSIAEWKTDQLDTTAQLIRVGTEDRFLETVGTQKYAREEHGISSDKVVELVTTRLQNSL